MNQPECPAGIYFHLDTGPAGLPQAKKGDPVSRQTPKAESQNHSSFCLCNDLPSHQGQDRALCVAISRESHTMSLPINKEEPLALPGAGSFMFPCFHLLLENRPRDPQEQGQKPTPRRGIQKLLKPGRAAEARVSPPEGEGGGAHG